MTAFCRTLYMLRTTSYGFVPILYSHHDGNLRHTAEQLKHFYLWGTAYSQAIPTKKAAGFGRTPIVSNDRVSPLRQPINLSDPAGNRHSAINRKISHWIVSNFPPLCLTLQIKSKWTKERRRKDASSQKEQLAKPERKPKRKTRTGTTTPMGTNYSYPKRRKLTGWYVPLSLHAYSIFIH